MDRKKLHVSLLCHNCRKEFSKNLYYLIKRVREQKTRFFCSRKCASLHHSQCMVGKGNPNFGGTFHGKLTSDRTTEEMAESVRKMVATREARKSLHGERNGRWAGGWREVTCIICSKTYNTPPYRYRRIMAGIQQACCDHNCARLYAQTQVKTAKTSIEIKMANELTKREIAFEEQYILGNKFALDFYLPEYKIVIECDGDYWHTKPDVVKRDRSKNAYIAACGLTLFRFWEREINTSIEACVDLVLAEINTREIAA
ncbi:DUF559 domain-containing protein [Paenibacillus sediminis]